VTDQAFRTAQTGDVLYTMRVILFIALLCMGYSLSRPYPSGSDGGQGKLLPATEQDPPALSPWQRKASEKAVVRYAESQEKKWRRWNEAMFERPE
jgi:hypothetical protein